MEYVARAIFMKTIVPMISSDRIEGNAMTATLTADRKLRGNPQWRWWSATTVVIDLEAISDTQWTPCVQLAVMRSGVRSPSAPPIFARRKGPWCNSGPSCFVQLLAPALMRSRLAFKRPYQTGETEDYRYDRDKEVEGRAAANAAYSTGGDH